MTLYWDSWDRHNPLKNAGLSPRTVRSRATRASVPSEECIIGYNNNISRGGVIPPSSSVSSISSLNAKCVLTPPPLTPPPQGKGAKGMHVAVACSPLKNDPAFTDHALTLHQLYLHLRNLRLCFYKHNYWIVRFSFCLIWKYCRYSKFVNTAVLLKLSPVTIDRCL